MGIYIKDAGPLNIYNGVYLVQSKYFKVLDEYDWIFNDHKISKIPFPLKMTTKNSEKIYEKVE